MVMTIAKRRLEGLDPNKRAENDKDETAAEIEMTTRTSSKSDKIPMANKAKWLRTPKMEKKGQFDGRTLSGDTKCKTNRKS